MSGAFYPAAEFTIFLQPTQYQSQQMQLSRHNNSTAVTLSSLDPGPGRAFFGGEENQRVS